MIPILGLQSDGQELEVFSLTIIRPDILIKGYTILVKKFVVDGDYIFFADSVLQKQQLNSQLNIAMKKVSSDTLTAVLLSRNFKENVKHFVAQEKVYSFMIPIKRTLTYWKKFMKDVMAMVKQLGIPTFFLTLSCADLKLNELVSIISKINDTETPDKEITKLNYQGQCNILHSDPVVIAGHFQYCVEMLSKMIVNGTLGKKN